MNYNTTLYIEWNYFLFPVSAVNMSNLLSLLVLVLSFHSSFTFSASYKEAFEVIGREVVNFNYAWRFQAGNYDIVSCPDSDFSMEFNDVQCFGLFPVATASNSDDCRGACCGNVMCSVWQYSDYDGCWIGKITDCHAPDFGRVGQGGRKTPAQPPPPTTNERTSRDYDDSTWEIVDAPHDALINGEYDENSSKDQGYLPKNVTWYRKHFNLPADWKGKVIWVYFEGVFKGSNIYLNGQHLHYEDSGYTSFTVRLDKASSIFFGDGQENDNVLVVQSTPNFGYSGSWYEGGGIYRNTYLVAVDVIHFLPHGIYVATTVNGDFHPHYPGDISEGDYVDSVTLDISMDVINNDNQKQKRYYQITVFDGYGRQVGYTMSGPNTFNPGKSKILHGSITLNNAEAWSPARPYLYTVKCDLWAGIVTDTINITVGVRRVKWDADQGFFFNDVHFTWKGFNNHNNFAGVGIAVPDRINLFRAQSMRAVGANSWRMSHSPPIPSLLDIMDNLGILVWDENREYGNDSIWVSNQRNMVMRDRNHPSVMAWSFCNDEGCNHGDQDRRIANEFRKVSKEADPNRPVTANMNSNFGNNLTLLIDVQGFSRQAGHVFDDFHEKFPSMPTIGSECCVCVTQRGEDFPDSLNFILGNFNADCNKAQTEHQLNRLFVAGCMVWTLFDYYGKPSFYGWPHVSSSYGSIDLAGFAKASAYWYRSWWLYNGLQKNTNGGVDVPLNPPKLVNPGESPTEDNPEDGYLVHIVQHWEEKELESIRTIHVYTNAPYAELILNGKSQGVKELVWQGWAQWDDITYEAGYITAIAIDDKNSTVATHTVLTTGEARRIQAFIDVPNEDTGTGSALLLDGQDAGMVSAALIDGSGKIAHGSSLNVSFSIVSGPGRIVGVGNGDPACHEPNQATWRSAYHGLARAIVQVTEDQVTPNRHRIIQIDRDGGKRTLIGDPTASRASLDGIVVEVSAPGVGTATVTIPVSTDPSDGVLTTARKSRQ